LADAVAELGLAVTQESEGHTVDPDEALIEAWNLGEGEEGWSDDVMEAAEHLLPILVAAGYAETKNATWNFTPKGVARAMELERGKSDAG
jgi:hypothetical protein